MKKSMEAYCMKNMLAILTLILPILVHADDKIQLPAQFAIQCGDIAHKVPYDPSDVEGTMIDIDVKGQATQMDPSTITGYWSGGSGYTLNLTIDDVNLTGSQNPVPVVFKCFFGGPHQRLLLNQSMDCRSDLHAPPSMPGFNMFTAKMAIPMPKGISKDVVSADSITVRTGVDVSQGDEHATRYIDQTRELDCRYLPLP